MSQEDEFYSELDKRTARHSCCTFQTMIIFFGILLIIATLGTIYIVYQVKQINVTFPQFNLTESIKNSLSKKLNSKNLTNPQLDMVITSEEFSSIVSPGIKTSILEIDQMQAKIYETDIKIFGKLIKPLKSDIEITAVPIIQDGKIKLEIQKINAGKLSLPGLLNNEIEKSINKLLDANFASIYQQYQAKETKLHADELEIIGQLK
ncbi:MAG: hypothetical protein HW405_821 [Candidatus Berkelbacteria bacterium]|nr:hypothetical protein [Candidatus Berkelbacteria bacterium]